jgi:hypothetical protein
LADVFALRGADGAWGRVLALVETAAVRVDDADALNRVRHDMGVRAIVAGDGGAAAAYLRLVAADRGAAGNLEGTAATSAALALADQVPDAPNGSAELPVGTASEASVDTASPHSDGARSSSEPVRRAPKSGWLVAFALAAGVIAILVTALWPRTAPALAIGQLSTQPQEVIAGAPAQLCVEATQAAVVEIFPDGARLPGTGRNCVAVHPAVTTRYVAVATAADGRQVHSEATVDVRQSRRSRLEILKFGAFPARISAGQSTLLCYTVTGASVLRVVPSIGNLQLLNTCKKVTLREPHPYLYRLFATDESGHVAVRGARVDVVVAAAPRASAASAPASSAPDLRVARQAVYQFDSTPTVVERGQAASLCVGVERSARGYVTHVGRLSPGITRCYRVLPPATTVYRLYVTVRDVTAIETVTVAVRPAHRHEVARLDRH